MHASAKGTLSWRAVEYQVIYNLSDWEIHDVRGISFKNQREYLFIMAKYIMYFLIIEDS